MKPRLPPSVPKWLVVIGSCLNVMMQVAQGSAALSGEPAVPTRGALARLLPSTQHPGTHYWRVTQSSFLCSVVPAQQPPGKIPAWVSPELNFQAKL